MGTGSAPLPGTHQTVDQMGVEQMKVEQSLEQSFSAQYFHLSLLTTVTTFMSYISTSLLKLATLISSISTFLLKLATLISSGVREGQRVLSAARSFPSYLLRYIKSGLLSVWTCLGMERRVMRATKVVCFYSFFFICHYIALYSPSTVVCIVVIFIVSQLYRKLKV